MLFQGNLAGLLLYYYLKLLKIDLSKQLDCRLFMIIMLKAL
jgi:hypothetical protein